MKIGDNIKKLRQQKGIKQKDLAAMLHMPVSTLANYENNKREPSFDTIWDICQALDIDTLKFFNGDSATYMLSSGKSDLEKILTSDDPLITSIGEALVLLQSGINDCIEFYYSDNTAYKEATLKLINNLSYFIDPSWQFEYPDSDIINTTSDIAEFIKYKVHLLKLNHQKANPTNSPNPKTCE
ncbi:MAG: helix-turn-helix transcriptional regulator [Clostridiales bacterium]|uniref:helix-turn-helix domain-containing protein n=1 Tax=Clostridium sp. TaxID=1506 RepID=UPI00290C0665|nr:helix-turn-helix transcriptional regulator [Clostridium sp.]MDU6274048.1 helix-turn-helix transcriptional regulator [Clostridium sp.]MDU6360849.1 helix-turn-helix transcriptional regulator [Clostridiales bacterium]